MKKYDYLKLCINNKAYERLSWLISVFTTIGSIPKEKLNYLDLSNEPNGYHYYDNELVKIEDATIPLFTPNDVITIDNSWLPNVEGTIETTVGRLIANAVCVYESFRGNLGYINKKFTSSDIDDIVAPILLSDTEVNYDPSKVYVKDYMAFIDNVQYISNLSSVLVVSASPKVMIKPEGLDVFIAELITKYRGKLHDPVELANFEDELKDFDDKFLKDEASYGLFISGKVKDIARKKLFLSIGSGLGFTDKTKLDPILTSLSQGWNLNPKDYKTMIDDIRSGSFSRGSETVKGGVTFKTFIRATNGLSIVGDDCGSKLTLTRVYTDKDIQKLVDRYIVENGKVVEISNLELAKQYVNKPVQLRSTIYCKSKENTYCKVCSGNRITNNKNGLAILLSNLSAIILNASLKLFHGTVLSTAKVDLDKHIT